MLAAAVACIVGLLCAASFDISGVPEVNEPVVLALFACCAPFALQPFAGARALLTQQDASCEPQIGLHTTPKQAPKSCTLLFGQQLLEGDRIHCFTGTGVVSAPPPPE